MRLIDADALMDDIRRHSESYFADDFAHIWVDKQPTVEAQPVRHARLINAHPYGECSGCGELIDSRDRFRYCPQCGARLDEQEKQNETD